MTKIAVPEKLAYGLGDLASGVVFYTISIFLMFYYTDVFGISAMAAGTLVFVARSWDAVWDVFLGTRVDRTHTRWGQARPYILFGAPLFAITAIATFTVPAFGTDGKLIYAYISYIALMMAYSTVNIPYSTLAALMTSDPDDRTQLASVRMFFSFTSTLLVGAMTMPLVGYFGGGNKQQGFQLTMVMLSTMAVILFWLCFAGCKERVPAAKQGSGNVWADFRILLSNRCWWIMFAIALVTFTAFLIGQSVVIYYFTYVVGNAKALSLYFVFGGLGLVTGTVFGGRLAARFCKRRVVITSKLLSACLVSLFYVVDPQYISGLYALNFCLSLTIAVGIPLIWSMLADTADKIELDSGRRMVGLTMSSNSFAVKFGMGVGGALTGLMLSWIGYKAGVVQTEETMRGIRIMMSIVPSVGFLVVAALVWTYPLNRNKLNQLKLDLARARGIA